MRIAIVSDIHGNLPALEAVIADIKDRKPDMVINLGDCVSGPLWPREVCDLLISLNWLTIQGNCDRAVGEKSRNAMSTSDGFAYDQLDNHHRQWLANLQKPQFITKNIFACHGTPIDDEDYLTDKILGDALVAKTPDELTAMLNGVDAPIVLCGHSHVPRIIKSSGATTVLNPGSVGLPAYESEWEGKTYYAESGSPHARYAMLTEVNAKFSVDLIAIDYDYTSSAQKADSEKFRDYARALSQGAMS